jgi:N-acyl-D-aspartate/D-glutamate deacylase
VAFLALAQAQTFDIVIRGGRVMDPESGLDAVLNVGIRGKAITAVTAEEIRGTREIDARGLVVTPGFIDLHQHGQTPENYRLKAMDGVTTALELEIGVSPAKPWYEQRRGKALIHFGASAGHIPARMIVMKDTGEWLPRDEAIRRYATPEERQAIARLIEQDLRDGSLGVGFGFNYTPNAFQEELQEMFDVAARWRRPAFIHMRHGSHGEPGVLASIHEVIAYSVATGASAHIVHLGASSTKKFDLAIDAVARARAHGLDITAESYPYVAGMTRIETSIFDPGFEERLGLTYDNMVWVETGERLTKETFEKYRKKGGLVATFTNTEEMIRKNMAHPLVMVASDGIFENGKGHPRAAGTSARVLGRYVREQKALTLMEALRKLSLMPARRLEAMSPQMRRKGRVRTGADADLAVFDAGKVIDRATFEKPGLPSEGFAYVFVEGTPVVDGGRIAEGVFPGQGIVAARSPELVSVQRIWETGGHNAFTDLIRYQGRWLCTFREGSGHVGGDGKIRVIESEDGVTWRSVALLAEAGIDLRDPKLSVAPDGRLMMVMGGSVYRDGQYLPGRQPRVSFSRDGRGWSTPQRILAEGDWLWRVTWHKGRAYGVSYYGGGGLRNVARRAFLYLGTDGVHYERIVEFDRPDMNEVTLRFNRNDEMIALARCGTEAHIGVSRPPYKEWSWKVFPHALGGPNFVEGPDGLWIAGSRDATPEGRRTVLSWMSPERYEPFLTLPSNGDSSYPGFVWHDGWLWVSYYSSHEGKTMIYLAKVRP